MEASAVILPCRENFRAAIEEAIGTPRPIEARLYTDGHRVAWLPRALPGWFRIAAVPHEAELCAA